MIPSKPSVAKRLLSQSAAERKKQEADAEMGTKVIATLQLWYNEAILPLHQRVEQLERERAWWRKLAARLSRRRDTGPDAEAAAD